MPSLPGGGGREGDRPPVALRSRARFPRQAAAPPPPALPAPSRCHGAVLAPQDGGLAAAGSAPRPSLDVMETAFFGALLLLLAAPCSGQRAWDPGGWRASGAAMKGGLRGGEAAEGRGPKGRLGVRGRGGRSAAGPSLTR